MPYSGNGSGTQADPYQITTIYQLVELINIYNNTYIETYNAGFRMWTKLMNDLDFNDTPEYWDCPEGLFRFANNSQTTYTETDKENAFYLDGNNHGIYNLYEFCKSYIFYAFADGSSHQNHARISNLIIEAIVVESNNTGSGKQGFIRGDNSYNSGVFFTNCDIRIKNYRYRGPSGNDDALFRVTAFKNCIINIDFIANSDAYGASNLSYGYADYIMYSVNSQVYYNFYNEWNINIKYVSSDDMTAANKQFRLFCGTYHAFSSLFININAYKANAGIIRLSDSGCSMNNSYIVFKNNNTTFKGELALRYITMIGVNFYDTTKADSYLTIEDGVSGTLFGFTTAQCKDANFLEQQGFIIAI